MNYLYPWSTHFNISDDQIAEWESANETHLPLALWAIQNKKVSELDFLEWAQKFYSLPAMKSEFFRQPVDHDLWKKTSPLFVWTEVLMPLYQWDGTLFIGCIEPARNLDLNQEIQFVLCRHEDLCLRWHQYQNSDKGQQLRQVAFDEEAENPQTQSKIEINPATETETAQTTGSNSKPSPKTNPGMKSLGTVKLSVKPQEKKAEKKSANAVLADMMGNSDQYEVQVISPDDHQKAKPKEKTPPTEAAPTKTPQIETPKTVANPPQQPEGINLEALQTSNPENKISDAADFDQLAKDQGIDNSSDEQEGISTNSDLSESSASGVPEGMEGIEIDSASHDNQDSLQMEGLSTNSNIATLDFSSVTSSAISSNASLETENPDADNRAPEPPQASERPPTPPPASPPQVLEIDDISTGEIAFEAINSDESEIEEPKSPPPVEAPQVSSVEATPPAPPAPIPQASAEPPPPPSADEQEYFGGNDENEEPPEIEKSALYLDTNTSLQLQSVKNIDELATFIFGKMDKHFERKILFADYRGQGFEPIRWSEHWHATKNAKSAAVDVRSPNMFYIAHKTKKPFHGKVSPNPINDQFFVRWNKGQYLPAMTIYPIVSGEKVIAFLVGTPRSSDYNFDVLHQMSHIAPHVAPALSVISSLAS